MVSSRTFILECGSDRVSFGVFSRPSQRLCLHELAVETFPASVGQNRDTQWLENTGAALRLLRKRIKNRGAVTLLLPARLCLTKFIKLPQVEVAQREKILRFEAAQNIPYAIADVVWDSVMVDASSTEAGALLAAAKRDSLEALCSAVQLAGFEPRRILPATFATLAGFRLIREPDGESFLGVNLGAQSTTLVLMEKTGRFALRTFALGLEETTAQAAGGMETHPPFEKREPFSTRLFQEITRSLLHFQWRSAMDKPDCVYLSGIAADFSRLNAELGENLKIPVRTADFRMGMDFQQESMNGSSEERGALVDLIGAASTYFEPNQPVVNLLPPPLRERAGSRARRPWLVAAAIVTATILIPPLFHFRSLRDEALKKTRAIERELAPVRAWDRRNQENIRRLAEVKQDLALYRDTSVRRRSWLRLMSGLQEQLGRVEDVWLDKLQLVSAGPGEPVKLSVSGRMLDRAHPLAKASQETYLRVKTLLGQLAGLPSVGGVEAERFDNQQPGLLEFDFVLVGEEQRPL